MDTQDIENIIREIPIHYDENNALYTGNAGYFLFEILSDRIGDKSSEIAENILSSSYTNPTLCNGKVGVNWLFAYLYKEYGIIDLETLNEIRKDDENLKQISIEYLKQSNYDFMHGALGISYYFLYDSDYIDREYHAQILTLLSEQYERDGAFLYLSSYDETPEIRKVSLGLSHGLPSILRYVAECYKHGIALDVSKKLTLKLIDEIKSYQNKDTSHGYFPSMVHIDQELSDSPSRLAWCYGDPGVGIVLFHVGKILNDIELERFGEKILLSTTERKSLGDSLICDSGICHGAAGLIHIYNRMWLTTKNEKFKDAVEHWIEVAISLSQDENGIREYKRYNKLEEKWEITHNLLEGNAGVGLALNSYLSADCSWDYCLMLND